MTRKSKAICLTRIIVAAVPFFFSVRSCKNFLNMQKWAYSLSATLLLDGILYGKRPELASPWVGVGKLLMTIATIGAVILGEHSEVLPLCCFTR